jgi:hypothetical protein
VRNHELQFTLGGVEQYPDSKWSYYYDSGGLYDQAHSNAAVPDANTTSLANPNSSDFVWQRGYSWYPDTPGQVCMCICMCM